MTYFNLKNNGTFVKTKKAAAALIITLALYGAFSFVTFYCGCNTVKNDVVRLHILANSDSEADQNIKIKVRDALLEENDIIPENTENKEEVERFFVENKDAVSNAAQKILCENGFSYGAHTTVCREYFTTRTYGELTFPAGIYTSVKVTLGEGKGHNWWCVMFPPLCVPAAQGVKENSDGLDLLTDSGEKVVTGGERYEARFKIVELYEWLRSKL